jgi:hypothetical protein
LKKVTSESFSTSAIALDSSATSKGTMIFCIGRGKRGERGKRRWGEILIPNS